ncbi:MAG TPA: hypothetical protein VJ838_12335 [Gaiellaceae bacterium]|nr:hypothetical protein [Gaiellaceae bacterium]
MGSRDVGSSRRRWLGDGGDLPLRHGLAQSERDAIGPLRVLPHVGFAVAGFGLWLAYAITDNDATAWAAVAAIGAAFLLAGTFLITRDQHRRADLRRLEGAAADRATGSGVMAAAPEAAASGRRIPVAADLGPAAVCANA